MNVRRARPDEAAQIAEFQIAMARETEDLELDPATVAAGVQAVFDDANLGSYLVVEENGRLLASLMLTPEWSDWRNGTVLWIQSVYVLPEARGRGLYRDLYHHCQGLVGQDGVRGLRLYVDLTNENARKVYAHLGMDGDHYQLFEWMP